MRDVISLILVVPFKFSIQIIRWHAEISIWIKFRIFLFPPSKTHLHHWSLKDYHLTSSIFIPKIYNYFWPTFPDYSTGNSTIIFDMVHPWTCTFMCGVTPTCLSTTRQPTSKQLINIKKNRLNRFYRFMIKIVTALPEFKIDHVNLVKYGRKFHDTTDWNGCYAIVYHLGVLEVFSSRNSSIVQNCNKTKWT